MKYFIDDLLLVYVISMTITLLSIPLIIECSRGIK